MGFFFLGKPSRWRVNAVQKWWLELPFYLLELAAAPEMYESVVSLFKWNTRPLNAAELKLARSVFGEAIDYRRICIDNKAWVMCRPRSLLYVSFHTINAWGEFSPDTFIHELVHVWQFERLGAVYIARALSAQYSPEGYNYGGIAALRSCLHRGGSLLDFNLEQQAEIICDYYRIREGLAPCWGDGQAADLPVYEHFLKTIVQK